MITRWNHLIHVVAAKIPAVKLHLLPHLVKKVGHQVAVLLIHFDKVAYLRAALVGHDKIDPILAGSQIFPCPLHLLDAGQLLLPPGPVGCA